MRKWMRFLFVLVTISSIKAWAILPDSGWYWNANQSGRGFNIEIQNNLIFVSAFGYKSNGDNIWYVSGGTMSSDRFYSGTLALGSNGQCYGCAYRPNSATAVGTITVSFTDEANAVITMLGETITVTRQDFANLTTNPDALYGEWVTNEGDPAFPVYFAERISFSDPVVSSGVTYASGNITGSSSRVALGRYDSSISSWLVLLDSSTSYYTAYNFRFAGLNRIEGVSWTYLKTSSLSGPGTYFVAHRTKSRVRVKGGSAPGITKSLPEKAIPLLLPDVDDLLDVSGAMRARSTSVGTPGIDSRLIKEMEFELAARTLRKGN